MASFNQELSLCCFMPITGNGGFDDDVGTQHYCSHCGKLAEVSIIWPTPFMGKRTELAIRRYKDGDDFDQVITNYVAEVGGTLSSLLSKIRDGLYDGKPDKWSWSIDQMKWLKKRK